MTITVRFSKYYKPWLFAATDDNMPLLTAVHVDPDGWLIAVDGFAMSAIPCQIEGAPEDFAGVNLPAKFVEHACKRTSPYRLLKKGKDPHVEITLEAHSAVQRSSVNPVTTYTATAPTRDGYSIKAQNIAGKFPTWRQLIPSGINGCPKVYPFNSRYLADAAKALAIPGGAVKLQMDGNMVGLIVGDKLSVYDHQFPFAVIMKMFIDEDAYLKRVESVLALSASREAPEAIPVEAES